MAKLKTSKNTPVRRQIEKQIMESVNAILSTGDRELIKGLVKIIHSFVEEAALNRLLCMGDAGEYYPAPAGSKKLSLVGPIKKTDNLLSGEFSAFLKHSRGQVNKSISHDGKTRAWGRSSKIGMVLAVNQDPWGGRGRQSPAIHEKGRDRKMACITKRRGRWVIDCYDQHGKRYRKALKEGTTKTAAREVLRDIEEKIMRRAFLNEKKTPTFKEVAEGWLEHKKPNIRATTWKCMRAM